MIQFLFMNLRQRTAVLVKENSLKEINTRMSSKGMLFISQNTSLWDTMLKSMGIGTILLIVMNSQRNGMPKIQYGRE